MLKCLGNFAIDFFEKILALSKYFAKTEIFLANNKVIYIF